jgi:type I restriction enzyme S subunit
MTLRVHPDEIVAASSSKLLSIHPSWARVRLDQIASLLNGHAFRSAGFSQSGDMPLIRIRDVGGESTETRFTGEFDQRYVTEAGSLIVGMDGDFRVSVWRGPSALLNQRVCKIVVRDPTLYSERFLRWVLPGYLDAVHRETSSVTVKHLSSRTINDLPLPLPPLAEQERIVDAIEEQFSRLEVGVAALKRARQNLKRMRGAMLQAAITGRLVNQNPADEPARSWLEAHGKEVSKETDDANVPPGWTCMALGSLKTWSLYGPRFASDDYVPVGVPVVRTSDITPSGKILIDQAPKLALTTPELAKYQVCPGDILITRTGSIGTVAFIADEAAAIPGAYLILYRFGLPIEFSEYLFYCLQSWQIQRQLIGKSAGIGRPNLNAPSIDSIAINVPPFEELQRILAAVRQTLSLIDGLEAALDVQGVRGGRLTSAILATAFSGALVSQDSADEPAANLLKRITAGHTSSNGHRPTKARASHRRKAAA